MAEVDAIVPNGLTVASTFAGAGGSCLGYRMAGMSVLWANEFEPASVATYAANHPKTILDTRDIRDVSGQDILDAVGPVDILDGSPPCQSFSMAGKRSSGWGKSIAHADGTTQRSDDLFFEFARLLGELRPRAFVAENVRGLVQGVAKGYFKRIVAALVTQGYVVRARVLDAQWLGVPQHRERVVILGLRDDLGFTPEFPLPLPYRYSMADACPWLGGSSIEGANGFDGHAERSTEQPSATVQASRPVAVQARKAVASEPCPTVLAVNGGWSDIRLERRGHGFYPGESKSLDDSAPTVTAMGGAIWGQVSGRPLTIAEVKRLCSFPDDFELQGSYAQQWARLGNSVPPLMMFAVAKVLAAQLRGLQSERTSVD